MVGRTINTQNIDQQYDCLQLLLIFVLTSKSYDVVVIVKRIDNDIVILRQRSFVTTCTLHFILIEMLVIALDCLPVLRRYT